MAKKAIVGGGRSGIFVRPVAADPAHGGPAAGVF